MIIAGLVYAWFASDVRTFTHPAEVLTGLPIVVVAILLVRGGRSSREPIVPPVRVGAWVALALVLFVWEMVMLFSSPRHDYPTISSIGNAVLELSRLTHVAAFAIWLALGAYLTRRAWSRLVA